MSFSFFGNILCHNRKIGGTMKRTLALIVAAMGVAVGFQNCASYSESNLTDQSSTLLTAEDCKETSCNSSALSLTVPTCLDVRKQALELSGQCNSGKHTAVVSNLVSSDLGINIFAQPISVGISGECYRGQYYAYFNLSSYFNSGKLVAGQNIDFKLYLRDSTTKENILPNQQYRSIKLAINSSCDQ